MNQIQTEVYHAWLRQQLEVSDIQESDFKESERLMIHRITWALEHPSETVKAAHQIYQIVQEMTSKKTSEMTLEAPLTTTEIKESGYLCYINAVASQVAHTMDGTQLNDMRQHTGKSYRRDLTQKYIQESRQEATPLPAFFIYNSYTGITSDVSSDWTRGYNGIWTMGSFDSYPTEKQRDAALYNEDTRKRWPENEMWPVSEEETLYHLLRIKQFRHDVPGWYVGCALDQCDRIYERCEHQETLNQALDLEWQKFLDWQKSPTK